MCEAEKLCPAIRPVWWTLGLLGWLATIISCALPLWRVTPWEMTNGTAPVWEGLWMCCAVHGSDPRHCAAYDSLLYLPQDLQAARVLTLIAACLGLVAVAMGAVGALCCPCVGQPGQRGNLAVAAGILFLVCGVLMLLTAGWSTYSIGQDRDDPLVALDAKRQPGAAIYLAFAAGAAQLLGGILLCLAWPRLGEVNPDLFHKASSTAQRSDCKKV